MHLKRAVHRLFNTPITGSQLYLIAFSLYFIPAFLIDTTFTQYLSWSKLRLITYIAIPIILFKIYILDKWNWQQLIIITMFIIIGVLGWRAAKYPEILMMMVFILGARGVPFREIIKWYFYLSVSFMIVLAVVSLLGIIPNLTYYSMLRPTRYSLGMAYTTFIASHVLYIAFAYCYLHFGKLNWQDYLGILVIGLIVMKITDTRLDFYEMVLLIPVMIIAQRAQIGKRYSQFFVSFWWMATPVLAAITLISSYFYSPANHIYFKLNSLLSGRLHLSNVGFRRYPISILGRRIAEHSFGGSKGASFANHNLFELSTNYFYIDSAFVRMLLVWGSLVLVFVIGVIIFITIRDTVQRNYALPAIFLLIAINSVLEPHILQIIYNPFLIALLATEIKLGRVNNEFKSNNK